ncbi:MAG TPA: hypothetical protein VKF35_10465 [Hyphomicrobiaceae bacterium]|nr:hypothetical protein [Hyphomicrobiaceae bacterium]
MPVESETIRRIGHVLREHLRPPRHLPANLQALLLRLALTDERAGAGGSHQRGAA